MQWGELGEHQRITKATGQRYQGECLLTWEWPKDIQYVYIYAFKLGEELPYEQLSPRNFKLLTREEYKTTIGFRERSEHIGVIMYRIIPCVRENGEIKPLKQFDEHNVIRIAGSRAQIRYKVSYGRGWFQKRKPVTLELFCEIPVPRNVLCYVKKQGEEPFGREDGVVYPLLREFTSGRQMLPGFEIGKDEFVRLFLTDGKMYGEFFELIRE